MEITKARNINVKLENRYISMYHLNKVRRGFARRGRPRADHYLLSDISPKTRAQLNKVAREYMKKARKIEPRARYIDFGWIKNVWVLAGVLALFCGMLNARVQAETNAPIITPIGSMFKEDKIQEDQTNVTEIKRELAIKFGFDAPTAWGILRAESNRGWKPGQDLNTNSVFTTPFECSVGLFQINLADNYCEGNYVHYFKAYGDDVYAKVNWLKNWRNNIRVASEIYKVQGFKPWSTFQDGRYKQYEAEF